MNPKDASELGVADGERVRLTTKRGAVEVPIEVSEMMQAGHVSLPNGLGIDQEAEGGALVRTGVALNELTNLEDRDWLAGTPWHKHVAARIEALA
jgi:anaerobic selenocysteine-containing dehydrogenase